MSDYISRDAAIDAIDRTDWFHQAPNKNMVHGANSSEHQAWFKEQDVYAAIESIPAADVREVPEGGIGEMSDGYHTFNGLYHQRLILFAALVKQNKSRAWKSHRHEDGELCFGGGWFIVGIDTPEGSYTYHYEDKDWGLFDCVELPVAKHWDGHTEEDVTRLLSLPAADVRPRWIPVGERLPETGVDVLVKFPQNMAVASIDIGEWVVNSGDGWCTDINLAGGEKNPTHWMPLPQPPKEKPTCEECQRECQMMGLDMEACASYKPPKEG